MSIEIQGEHIIINRKTYSLNDLCLYKYKNKKLTLQFLIPDNNMNRNLKEIKIKVNQMKYDSLLILFKYKKICN